MDLQTDAKRPRQSVCSNKKNWDFKTKFFTSLSDGSSKAEILLFGSQKK
jgi:hypothetical protein